MEKPCSLIIRPSYQLFNTSIRTLSASFQRYCQTSSSPLPTGGLIITPEVRYQSELYIPISIFGKALQRILTLSCPHYYGSALHTITPSWADWCSHPSIQALGCGCDPGRFLHNLLTDYELLTRFVFSNGLPYHHNGRGFGRYPEQTQIIIHFLRFLRSSGQNQLVMEDIGCGSGEGTWELLLYAQEARWSPLQVHCRGITPNPLEVWAATQRWLPHLTTRCQHYRQKTEPLIQSGWGECIDFAEEGIIPISPPSPQRNLILCNGLLAGPALNSQEQLTAAIKSITNRLASGGLLCIADRFHDGWKQQEAYRMRTSLLEQSGFHLFPKDDSLFAFKDHVPPLFKKQTMALCG